MSYFEYYSDKKGRTRSVFQCGCECDELDDCFTEMFDGHFPDNARIRRLLDDIQDRIRIPWAGGARKLDPDAVHVALIGYLVYQVSSWRLFQMFWGTVVFLIALLIYLGLSHLLILKIRSRSCTPVLWLVLSIGVLYLDAEIKFSQYMPLIQALFARVAFVCLVISFWKCFSAPVGLDATDAHHHKPPSDLSKEELQVVKDSGLRWCRICQAYIPCRDHHCVWVGTCIGSHNQILFITFLFLFWLLGCWFAMQKLVSAASSGSDKSLALFVSVPQAIGSFILLVSFNQGGWDVALALYALIGAAFASSMGIWQIKKIVSSQRNIKVNTS